MSTRRFKKLFANRALHELDDAKEWGERIARCAKILIGSHIRYQPPASARRSQVEHSDDQLKVPKSSVWQQFDEDVLDLDYAFDIAWRLYHSWYPDLRPFLRSLFTLSRGVRTSRFGHLAASSAHALCIEELWPLVVEAAEPSFRGTEDPAETAGAEWEVFAGCDLRAEAFNERSKQRLSQSEAEQFTSHFVGLREQFSGVTLADYNNLIAELESEQIHARADALKQSPMSVGLVSMPYAAGEWLDVGFRLAKARQMFFDVTTISNEDELASLSKSESGFSFVRPDELIREAAANAAKAVIEAGITMDVAGASDPCDSWVSLLAREFPQNVKPSSDTWHYFPLLEDSINFISNTILAQSGGVPAVSYGRRSRPEVLKFFPGGFFCYGVKTFLPGKPLKVLSSSFALPKNGFCPVPLGLGSGFAADIE